MYANAEAAGVSLVASEARPGQLPLRRAFCSLPRQVRILRRPVFLHTGTGTAQTTAISTAAITAVIFSLVDRFTASSKERKAEHRARPRPLPVHRLAVYAVTQITLRPATSRVYRRASLSALARGGAFGGAVGFGSVAGSSFASAERNGSRRGA
jgi:hypothetical protein